METVERYYTVLKYVDFLVSDVLAGWCYTLWVRPFLGSRRAAYLTGAAYAAVMFFLFFGPFYIPTMLAYAIGTAAGFAVMALDERKYIGQKLYLAVVFYSVRWQMWRIVSNFFVNGVSRLQRYFLKNASSMAWFKTDAALRILWDTTALCLMYLGFCLMHKAYGRRREEMDMRELTLLTMPVLSGVVAEAFMRWHMERCDTAAGYDGEFDSLVQLYAAVCFLTVLLMAYVFRRWKDQQEDERCSAALAGQIADMEMHIAQVEGLYRDMRSIRHDMANHLLTLEDLYKSGAYEEAGGYAGRLHDRIRETTMDVQTGNPVTDVVLSGKKKEMEEKGIPFVCDFHYPKEGEVNAFDISTILNNGLANAIDASKGDMTHVSLSSRCVKNMYMIEIVNDYTGQLQIDEQSGLPVSTKTGEGHGVGLENIRRAAQKYLGGMEIGKEKREGRECCVLRVMLQLR